METDTPLMPAFRSAGAYRYLARKALRLRKSLISHYRKAFFAASLGETAPETELFLSGFYTVEKLMTAAIKELDKAKKPVLERLESGTPRILALAENLPRASFDRSSVEAAFAQPVRTAGVSRRELGLLPECVRLECLARIDRFLTDGRSDAETLKRLLMDLGEAEELPWDEIIGELSPVDGILRSGPGWDELDKSSRELCVSETVRISGELRVSETETARAAVELARTAKEERKRNTAYYLAAGGADELRAALRPSRQKRSIKPGVMLFVFIAAATLPTLVCSALFLRRGLVFSILTLFPSALISLSLVTTVFTLIVRPRRVPRINAERADGNLKTAVAVPVLLSDANAVDGAIRSLESHYLGNPLEGAVFILLGDLRDSETEHAKGDDELIERARAGMDSLISRCGERFVLLIRERTRNADGVWQGHERKRGAVTELLKLLNGEESCFRDEKLSGLRAKYLCVLDADTVLPPGTLKKLIGAAAHPANRPVFREGRVAEGYAVFAPRMRTTSESAAKTVFSRLFSGDAGYESYSQAVSDLSMDAFSEGDFGGKGMINVEAFLRATEGRIPDNAVLSHDLLEGSLARTAYLSDVVLFDSSPGTLPKWWKRQERWIRGDWQLLPFIFGKHAKHVPGIGRAKMLGNLVRSLREALTLVNVTVSVVIGSPLMIAYSLLAFAVEPVKGFFLLAFRSMKERAARDKWLVNVLRTIVESLALPYSAYVSGKAIASALYRTLISNRKMLLWQTAADAKAGETRLAAANLAYSLTLAGYCAGSLAIRGPSHALLMGLILSADRTISPLIIRTIDRERPYERTTANEKVFVFKLLYRAWSYFSEQCCEETNWLPPDNVQEFPERPPAKLTSPTDIGMAITTAILAHDLGVIDDEEFTVRSSGLLSSLEKLEKWKGIPFNWYAVKGLEAVHPRFVSSVDAGNLLAALMVLAPALREVCAFDAAGTADRLSEGMELNALYDPKKKLFRIGFDAENGLMTPSYYDLYASEARLLSFVAAARGIVPEEHFAALSRIMRDVPGGRTLVSWSGTAFEYLMPLIFFRTVPGSLQYETALSAVRTMMLSAPPDRPWGSSESGYYAFDQSNNYQYRAFGEPALALEPRREEYSVTAPYASALSLFVEPSESVHNLKNIVGMGCFGRYGLYEAIDYGTGSPRLVKSFMAHHKGMEAAAYAAFLGHNGVMERFMEIPAVRAHEQLLFEELPLTPIVIREYESSIFREPKKGKRGGSQARKAEKDALDCAVIANNSGSVLVLPDGSGVSSSGGITLTDGEGVGVYVCGDSVRAIDGDPVFEPHCARFSVTHEGVKTSLSVFRASEANAEVREIVLVNTSREEKKLRIGAFFRPVLVSEREFEAHPAFVRLTVDAERAENGIIFRRREKRGREPLFLWAALTGSGSTSLSSDAYDFPGRLTRPASALAAGRKPSAFNKRPTEPCFAAVAEETLPYAEARRLIFVMGLSQSRDEAEKAMKTLVKSYEREKELSPISTLSFLRETGIEPCFTADAGPIAALITKRIPFKPEPFGPSSGGVGTLWELGISGDRPIIAVTVSEPLDIAPAARFGKVSRFLEAAGAAHDAVVISGFGTGYGDPQRARLTDALGGAGELRLLDGKSLTHEQLNAIKNAALISAKASELPFEAIKKPETSNAFRLTSSVPRRRGLELFNGMGGFDAGAEEYVVYSGEPTPAPWSNILANESFGSLVTENGGGYTWADNARLMRLTPFSCDPIRDPCGERITLITAKGELPLTPCADGGVYEIAHGLGYTVFGCAAEGLEAELVQFVDFSRPIKYFLIKARNTGRRQVSLKIRADFDWTVGETRREEALSFSASGGILFVDSFRRRADGRSAFLIGGEEFDGGTALSPLRIPAGEVRSKVFLLGMDSREKAFEYEVKLTDPEACEEELVRVKNAWRERLSALKVSTGNVSFDLLVNRLLGYQLYSSRLFGRTGFYQSGGAFGFRDRLQDAGALLLTDPARARAIIIDSARLQFNEGDVLHWRHGNGPGVRTRISDDRLFLPYACLDYVRVTGDASVWDETAPYLTGEPLGETERDRYSVFSEGELKESIFRHCVRAIKASMKLGKNGLPLMGAGDWNDGFDEAGGESAFNGWFLLVILEGFIPVSRERGEEALADELSDFASGLRRNMEATWEGDRYLRAITEDGRRLGSKESPECALDLVSAVWAVFAGAEHGREGFMTAVNGLYDEKNAVIRLLWPPFGAGTEGRLGYIGSYSEGSRENGGQYTHAAAWAAIAACGLGMPELAERLFETADPIAHGGPVTFRKYRTEPYAVAGDVCGYGENTGTGGWTWYTGAAGWLYRAAVEHILGIKKTGDRLKVEPVTVLDSFEFELKYGSSVFVVRAKRGEVPSYSEGGETTEGVLLRDDGKRHEAEVIFR